VGVVRCAAGKGGKLLDPAAGKGWGIVGCAAGKGGKLLDPAAGKGREIVGCCRDRKPAWKVAEAK